MGNVLVELEGFKLKKGGQVLSGGFDFNGLMSTRERHVGRNYG